MNSTIYIFGNLGNGYTQFPDDYAKDIYQEMYAKSSAQSQIIIHRDNNLMYYGYTRKLDVNSQFIGFCILFNGIMISKIKPLFDIFENTVADLVARGEILYLNNKGEIKTNTNNLIAKQDEVEHIISRIKNEISELEKNAKKLPPVNYAIANNESKYFNINDPINDIVDATCKYGYTCILKDKNYDTSSLANYKNIIVCLNKEKDSLITNYEKLKSDYDRLVKQKKQYEIVTFLCVLIFIFGIGLLFLISSLGNTRNNLEVAQNSIKQKNSDLDKLNRDYDYLKQSLYEEELKSQKFENELSNIKSTISEYFPLIIKDVKIANAYEDGAIETDYGEMIFSSSSMYLKPQIIYYGINEQKITLNVKFYSPFGLSQSSASPQDYSWTDSFIVECGESSQILSGWGNGTRGNWPNGVYRCEFWFGNVCLMAKTFTVY